MAKREKRTRIMIIKLTQTEFDELEKVAGHYKNPHLERSHI